MHITNVEDPMFAKYMQHNVFFLKQLKVTLRMLQKVSSLKTNNVLHVPWGKFSVFAVKNLDGTYNGILDECLLISSLPDKALRTHVVIARLAEI